MNEYLFEFSNTNESKTVTGNIASAKKIERLLLQKQSFINGGGVNIHKYKFEQNNLNVMAEIENDIAKQINTYLPDVKLNEVRVEKRDDNSILIGFSIGADKPFIFGVNLPDDASVLSELIY